MRLEVKINTQTDPLNIRKGPGTSNAVVGTIPKGSIVIVNKLSNGWYQLEDGRGWISQTYIKVVRNLETEKKPETIPTPNATKTTLTTTTNTATSKGIDKDFIDLLKSNVARADRKIDGSVRLFGCPFQFTKTTDYRIDSNLDLGRNYLENIIAESPIVYFLPGKPKYLPELSKEEKLGLTEFLSGKGEGDNKTIIDKILKNKEEIRYFDFTNDYADYIRYVNMLCRMSAIYIGIGDKLMPGTNKKYKYYDWANYKYSNDYVTPKEKKERTSIFDVENIVESVDEALFGKYRYTQFYVEPNTSFSESASNSTQASKLAGVFDTAEGIMKEMAFLTNTAAIKMASDMQETLAKEMNQISQKMVSNGSDNFFSRLFGLSSNVISGSNIIFPELWGDSAYNKSYNINMHFVSPYGDKESVYLNVIVPLMHLLALALPRQTSANSFMSPFLVKVFSKGWFSCEMGMIDSINIQKGGDGAWNVDGLPTEMRVEIGVRDLYNNLMITPTSKASLFFQNQGLIDFLAVTCGVIITETNLMLKLRSQIAAFLNKPLDLPGNIYRETIQFIRNKLDPIFKL
jgi:hypothetical protein